jgi:hypothetical protein
MSKKFPDYPYGDFLSTGDDVVEQTGQFGDLVEDAREKGVIGIAPESRAHADKARTHYFRNRTISTWLWMLGYLPSKPPGDASPESLVTTEFLAAVEHFQMDAGLYRDSWVGNDTWHALNDLVGFESDVEIDKWFRKDGSPLPALQRAVQLRLFSLGLFPSRPGPDFRELNDAALDNFRWINFMFNLSSRSMQRKICPETVSVLYDQDNMVEKISMASDGGKRNKSFQYTRPERLEKRITDKLANKFIINVAKAELWLLGLKIKPDGSDDYSITNGGRDRMNPGFFDALVLYYMELENKDRKTAEKLSKKLTPDFFESLHRTRRVTEGKSHHYGDEDASDVIDEHLDSNQKIEEAWGFAKRKSVTLWDGLKRLWRWIKRGIKKIFSFFTKNVFRVFFRYVTKAFKIVKIGIDAVIDTIGYIVKPVLPDSNTDVAIFHDGDFDHTVFISSNAEPEKAAEMSRKLEIMTAKFSLGSRILGFIIEVFKKMGQGFVGWARLLKALVNAIKELKPLYRELKSAKVGS